MQESLSEQLTQLHNILSDVTDSIDVQTSERYAWMMVKVLNANLNEVSSLECRRLLADYVMLPVPRPSRVHSAVLSVAVRVASAHPEFRFLTFLRMWDVANLRDEDCQKQMGADGKVFPALSEKLARAVVQAAVLRPEDYEEGGAVADLLQANGLSVPIPMIVTAIKETQSKDGRKYHFATLTSPDGLQFEALTNVLSPHPLHPLPVGKRHWVNVGQIYHVSLRTVTSPQSDTERITRSTIHLAYLSSLSPQNLFPIEIGYVDSIDGAHAHIHIHDSHSRHFVAPVQRFSKEKVGDFVRFIPIIPRTSKFKSAIILSVILMPTNAPALSASTIPAIHPEVKAVLREIRITHINREKGYASWELADKSVPITETLSPIQLSEGETSPAFTTGFLSVAMIPSGAASGSQIATVSDDLPSGLTSGQSLQAFIYLKRGKDRQKRPCVARVFKM